MALKGNRRKGKKKLPLKQVQGIASEISKTFPFDPILRESINHSLEAELRALYPHGHPEFIRIALEKIKNYSSKNLMYAGGGSPLGNFQRVAWMMEMYPKIRMEMFGGMAVAFMFMAKHLDKVLWDLNNGVMPSEENFNDLGVYIDIMRCMCRDQQPIKQKEGN